MFFLIVVEVYEEDGSQHGGLDPGVQVHGELDGEVVGVSQHLLDQAAELLGDGAHVLALGVRDGEDLVPAAHGSEGQTATARPLDGEHVLVVGAQDLVARAAQVAVPHHGTWREERGGGGGRGGGRGGGGGGQRAGGHVTG